MTAACLAEPRCHAVTFWGFADRHSGIDQAFGPISQELATKLMAWRHPGFSAHVAEPISTDDTPALENLAGYVARNPLSLQRLVYLDGQQAVIYGPPEEPKPPPAVHEVVRVPVAEEGREMEAPCGPPGRQGRQISLAPLPQRGSSLPPQR